MMKQILNKHRKEILYSGIALLCFVVLLALTYSHREERKPEQRYQMVVLGDSLLGGLNRGPESVPGLLAERLDMTVYNGTLGGTSMSYLDKEKRMGYTKDCLSMAALAKAIAAGDFGVQQTVRIRENATEYFPETIDGLEVIDFEQVEILLLEFGVNDYHVGTPIYPEKDVEDVYTFVGAIRSAVLDIRNAYPDVRIVLLTPTYSWYPPKELTCEEYDLGGGYLEEYVDAEIAVAGELGVEVIDLYHDVYPHETWEDWHVYTNDGLHPNETGSVLLADKIVAYLQGE